MKITNTINLVNAESYVKWIKYDIINHGSITKKKTFTGAQR